MPRFVEVWERAGYMSSAEAATWRERIAIWQRFGLGGHPAVRVVHSRSCASIPTFWRSCSRRRESLCSGRKRMTEVISDYFRLAIPFVALEPSYPCLGGKWP